MGKVIGGMTMSLDGFISDKNGSVAALYPNFDELRESDMMQESMRNTGAVVMGRNMYDMANGDFTGYEYQVPIFIVTHHIPEKVAKGENDKLSFTFVTDGSESAVKQAQAAAGEKDIAVVAGPDLLQQLLSAGLIDEIQIGIMPVLLGEGLPMFKHVGAEPRQLEKVSLIESPGGRTDITFRVI